MRERKKDAQNVRGNFLGLENEPDEGIIWGRWNDVRPLRGILIASYNDNLSVAAIPIPIQPRVRGILGEFYLESINF